MHLVDLRRVKKVSAHLVDLRRVKEVSAQRHCGGVPQRGGVPEGPRPMILLGCPGTPGADPESTRPAVHKGLPWILDLRVCLDPESTRVQSGSGIDDGLI